MTSLIHVKQWHLTLTSRLHSTQLDSISADFDLGKPKVKLTHWHPLYWWYIVPGAPVYLLYFTYVLRFGFVQELGCGFCILTWESVKNAADWAPSRLRKKMAANADGRTALPKRYQYIIARPPFASVRRKKSEPEEGVININCMVWWTCHTNFFFSIAFSNIILLYKAIIEKKSMGL